jgi:hypothetical protein
MEAKMARVQIRKQTTNDPPGDWQLWLQWCRYELDDETQFGYRYIWTRPDGALQAARGQARIPSLAVCKALMDKATAEGWGDRDSEKVAQTVERLEKEGCVISIETGYVGWPNKEAAQAGHLTQQMIDDARLIADWT